MTQFKPRLKPLLTQLVAVLLGMLLSTPHATNCLIAQDELLWIEGEQATESRVIPHPWYDQVQKDRISDGKLLSHFDNTQSGQATYVLTIPADGRYEFWVRGNPVQSRMEYRLDSGSWTAIDFATSVDRINIAADEKPDLRFLAWTKVSNLDLKAGKLSLQFRFTSENHNHGYLDCFVLSQSPFEPKGALKPADRLAVWAKIAQDNPAWFPFPQPDKTSGATNGFDLRELNEPFAGSGGFIQAKNGKFVHGSSGETVRFWGVNGPPHELKSLDELRRLARWLAKYGVNLVRFHGALFDEQGNADPAKVQHAMDVVEAMKGEGIYTHFSIYFPLWIKPKPDTSWLAGYSGQQYPFAALYFNPDFQAQYRTWWDALLTTPSPHTGRPLTEEPAVFGVELINEDSFFFWTFAEQNLPKEQWELLEAQFGRWLADKYGSLEQALSAWNQLKHPRDDVSQGRMGFRPLWNLFNDKSQRDQDTVVFLASVQRGFYQRHYDYLRSLGFKGMITTSNWTTASPQVLGPLEKLTYTVGDFVDRHGYFGGQHEGDQAEWSIRVGHRYTDRSGLRFDAARPQQPRVFEHPAFDPSYNNLPSMISETTYTRPNRFRSEAPLFYASYGALQDSDAIVHFALDGPTWAVQPNFFMQPWTLMAPAMMGQFPAAALIYRRGYIDEGQRMVRLELDVERIEKLEGTPLPQGASLDELRLADVPPGKLQSDDGQIDPLVHLAGPVEVHFKRGQSGLEIADAKGFIDRQAKRVTSSNGQLELDYERGSLLLKSSRVQGASGNLKSLGKIDLQDIQLRSELELGHIVAVSLDGKPLQSSSKMLAQVMSEERPHEFQVEPVSDPQKSHQQRIVSIGSDPWMVRQFDGEVRFKRSDAEQLKVIALEHSGSIGNEVGTAEQWTLSPDVLYYLIVK